MKHNLIIRILSVLLFIGASVAETFAQGTGKIAGKLSDKKTGETLIGVSVKISGAAKGTTTDVEGRYNLGGLEAGTFTLEFSYIGYPTKKISDVIVSAGKVTTLDVVMEESGQQLQQVVITASAKQASLSALYAQQKNSVSISSGVSAEQIRISPDRNTSQVLKRVSGASIQDNKFVVVRGLSDRYNSSTLNNAILPSTESDRKAFSFDIIPSNLIDRIVVNKTASPDLPGDFAGGLVQVFTKDVPDEDFIDFTYGLSYNKQSTFKDFKSGPRGKTDFFGFSNGSRAFPSSFDPGSYALSSTSTQQRFAITKGFQNNFGIGTYQAAPSQNFQLTWGNQKKFNNGAALGSMISLSHRNTQSINPAERYDYEGNDIALSYQGDQYRYNTNLGLLANIAFVKGNNKIALKNTFNKSLDDVTTIRNGMSVQKNGDVKDFIYVLGEKSLFSSQLEGDHKLSEKGTKFTWNANYSYNTNNQPDLRALGYVRSFGGYNGTAYPSNPYLAQVPRGASANNDARRFSSELDESSVGAALNLNIPYELFKSKSNLKFGYLGQYKFRESHATVLGYVVANSNVYDEEKMASQSPDQIFAPENIGNDGFVLSDITNANDKYDATSLLNAGYIMTDSKIGENLRVILGARVESYLQDVNSRGKSGEVFAGNVTYLDVLPSLNVSYSLTDKTNLRFSASQTVSRPELREVSAFSYYDFVSFSSISGNPNLKRSQNINLDLKYEVYPRAGETISASVFYKNFNNAIEQIILPGSNIEYRLRSFNNVKSAITYGLELELRKKLDFISDNSFLSNTTFFTNLALIQSEVDLSGVNGATGNRSLQGQSPYLINSGLQYFAPKNGIGFSVLYNRIGSRISDVGFVG
ncbi:MAG: TonB-dependent receptor domain-containing protein, partial [Sphingobacteriaceae bacterium]